MPSNHSGKRTRVPWRSARNHRGKVITLPVFMAYCAVAGVLRSWNRVGVKAIVTLQADGDFHYQVYADAANYFASQIWNPDPFRWHVCKWSDKSFRDEMEALEDGRAIFLAPPDYNMSDDDVLFSDVVLPLSGRSERHAEAALRRAGLPITDEDLKLLLSEPWSRLYKAFQDRRDPLQALQRLRGLQNHRPADVTAEVKPMTGPKIQDLHGYGRLVDWGFELAKDLADYKAGVISWSDIDTGVLISGPPGVGKTRFASALANTCEVPIVVGSVSRWQEGGALDAHLKAMRASFAEAKAKAPAILFVDEVDTLGDRSVRDRNEMYLRAVMAAFLELLDGYERREGVVVVGACNFPDRLDPAVRRAGRLDRHIEVTLPDALSRRSILKFHTGITLEPIHADQFDLATDGLSGADIEQLARAAKRVARRQSGNLTGEHIVGQLRAISSLSDEYIRTVAVHEAGHAIIGFEVQHGRALAIKIASHAIAGQVEKGGSVEYERSEPQIRTRAHYENAIAVSLGGIAAELEVFGSFADGAAGTEANDLNQATRLATAIEGAFGMGHTLVVGRMSEDEFTNMRTYNPALRREVHKILNKELVRVRSLIREQRHVLDEMAAQLVKTRGMTGEEVLEIIHRHRRSNASVAEAELKAGN